MPAAVSASKNVVSTWIVLDDAANATNFPQMGLTNSADPKVQQRYWQCVAVFFATAARTNSGAHLRLYTTEPPSLPSAGDAVRSLLERFEVEVVSVPLHHLPPAGYFGRWRNQFYILDVLDAICAESGDRNYTVLDSDCLLLRPLDAFFAEVERCGALTLDVGERCGDDINGLTREQMQALFREMGGCDLETPPEYWGGELFAATADTVRRMQPLAEKAWQDSLERFADGLPRLNEEAHLLTYVYYQLGLQPASANPFMKRLWTNRKFRNGVAQDRQLTIAHLPGEKMFGYPKLFRAVADPQSWFYGEQDDALWLARVQAVMSIPRPTLLRLGVEVVNSIRNRIRRSRRG